MDAHGQVITTLVLALRDDDGEAFEVEAACGHRLSPVREDLSPCEGCARCGRCPRCGERWYAGCDCPVGAAEC